MRRGTRYWDEGRLSWVGVTPLAVRVTHSCELSPERRALAVSLPAGRRGPYARVVPFLPVPPPGWRRGARLTWVGGSNLRVLVEGAERAQRRQVIVNAARELAESEGWEAVTTRRLADRTEYSSRPLQPFRGQRRLRERSSLEGFGELAALLHNANKGPFACCKAASGGQHLHQGVKIRLPLTRLTDGAKDLRGHSQPPVHSIKRGVEGTRGGVLGHDPLGTKSRSCLTPFPLETGAPGTLA